MAHEISKGALGCALEFHVAEQRISLGASGAKLVLLRGLFQHLKINGGP